MPTATRSRRVRPPRQKFAGVLGTMTSIGASGETQPTGFNAPTDYTISCRGLADITVAVSDIAPSVTQTGVCLLVYAGDGSAWWNALGGSDPTVQGLRPGGFRVVMVEVGYGAGGWPKAPNGSQAGAHVMANRVATLVQGVYDVFVTDPTYDYVVMGSSGGSSALAYALHCYPQLRQIPAGRTKNLVTGWLLDSGPPHGAIAKGGRGDAAYVYSQTNCRQNIDAEQGYNTPPGPAENQDRSIGWPLWTRSGLSTGNFDRALHGQRVHVCLGASDASVAIGHAGDYMAPLLRSDYTRQTVAGGAHADVATGAVATARSDFARDLIRVRRALQATAVTAGTTITVDLTTHTTDAGPVNVGTLLYAIVYASTPNANLTLPAGWAWATDEDANTAVVDYNAAGSCVGVAWKRATAEDTTLTITASGACDMELRLVEELGFTNPVVDSAASGSTASAANRTISGTENVATVRVVTVVVTGYTTGHNSGNTYTNSYIRAMNVNGRADSARKSNLAGISTVSTNESISGGASPIGQVMANFREAP